MDVTAAGDAGGALNDVDVEIPSEEDRDDVVPRPDTVALLRFIDFIYAVVFTTFVRNVFTDIIFAPPTEPALNSYVSLDWPQFLNLLLAGLVFFFVARDWIHARELTGRENYRNYTRFFIDLAVAFAAYGALTQAAEGSMSCVFYVFLMNFGGKLWAAVALYQNQESSFRRKLRLLLGTHTLGSLMFGAFTFFYTIDDPPMSAALLWRFAILLFAVSAVEEISHVVLLPKSQWVGPSGLPLPRGVVVWIGSRMRNVWFRLVNDPPPTGH
jgi:hypothetical protein